MMNSIFEKLPDAIHDAVIKEIVHSIEKPEITFVLCDGRILKFLGVVLFRSEAYFHLETISADALYVSVCNVYSDSFLIQEVKKQYKADGAKKWGDNDQSRFKFRSKRLTHINMYCNDWEFDVICEEVSLTGLPLNAKIGKT